VSQSTGLHTSIDRTPNSSLHVVFLDSFSVEDVIFLIEGDHLSSVVVSNTFLPLSVVRSHPFSSSMVSLRDTLSIKHHTIGIDTPDIFLHTVDKLMVVGTLILVFNLEPVSGHLDSLVVESSPLKGFHTSVVGSLVT